MTTKKWFASCAASLVGCTMALSAALPTGVWQLKAQDDSSVSQMVSDEETVYLNEIQSTDRMANFNNNWKFNLGDVSGAEAVDYDDSSWQLLNLPHDYSIDQDYTNNGEAESGYKPGGVGWYRKTFIVDEAAKGRHIQIQFNGVYMDATVYINGVELGSNAYGYTGFAFDLTDYIDWDGDNVIAVRVNHETPSSRWYSGSGIYRDVYVSVLDDAHIGYNGIYVSTPNLEAEQGGEVTTAVSTDVVNESDTAKNLTVRQTVLDGDSTVGAGEQTVTVAAGSTSTVDQNVMVNNPTLWSVDNPKLYTLVTEVIEDGEVTDTFATTFGYRYYNFDSDTGFSLNGENMKLKGVCLHHDQGALGSAADDDAIYRQVSMLKEMGANAIRITHNPGDEALIQAASELGLVVIDEMFDGWTQSKNGNYNDFGRFFNVQMDADNQVLDRNEGDTWAEFSMRQAIKASRNEASVILYSLGNEIMEGCTGYEDYPELVNTVISWADETPKSQMITFGDNKLKKGDELSYSIAGSIADAGGVVGTNYSSGDQYDTIHSNQPEWMLVGSETASAINSRGVYDRITGGAQTDDQKLTSYDYSTVGWGEVASDAWYSIITRDYLAGEFVWTGFDYIGEPTPWNGIGSGSITSDFSVAPKNSYFGIIDTAGMPKDSYYLYQSLWNDDVNTLHVLPAWNEDVVYKDENSNVPVVVYTDAAAAELFFTDSEGNKTSIGKKEFTQKTTDLGYTYQMYEGDDKSETEHQNLYFTWSVPYEDGTIEAVAYDKDGNVIEDTEGRNTVTTAGEAAKLSASANKSEIDANGTDLVYVEIDVEDADGTLVPDADNNITVSVEGGTLAGLDNGSQADHQSYRDDNRNAFSGKLMAIVRATHEAGDITVTASADGLESTSVTIKANDVGALAQTGFEYSKTYYVKTGTIPSLPDTVKAINEDGSTTEVPVEWESIDSSDVAKAGVLKVKGTANGQELTVRVYVIDEVGAILNYSTGVSTGTVPTLPESRPGVLADGTIMDAEFDVNWQMPEASAFDKEGIVTINGTADVFGQEMPVTATVRVGEDTAVIGDNVAKAANLSQSIPEDQQSDNLAAIIDGVTDATDANGRWSNYNYCINNPENNTANITFAFDTQQIFGQFVLYFFKDSGSATWPDAGTTTFEISEDGTNWTALDTTETIGEANGNIIAYTYDFSPVKATFVRLNVTNAKTTEVSGNPCTAIVEAQMFSSTSKFIQNTTAELNSVTVDGTALDLTQNPMKAQKAGTVEATAKDNASVTVLPLTDKTVNIVVQSEDGKTTNVYSIEFEETATEPEEPGTGGDEPEPTKDSETSYRAYNPNDGDHLYTTNKAEYENTLNAGWKAEGVGWVSPKTSNTPVYRVYDKNSGEHHYTMDKHEVDVLVNDYGWRSEGIAWYSDDAKTVKVYRVYNPNAAGAGRHHWTASEHEYKTLVSLGWKDEGTGFHALSAN